MDARWAAAGGLTVAAVAAMAAAWAFRAADPRPVPPAVESHRQEGAASIARSGPASPEPAPPPVVAAAPAAAPPLPSSPSPPLTASPLTAPPAPGPGAAAPPAASPASAARQAPRFDVVRVDRDGSAVVAGRAEPGATVTLMLDGAPVGEVAADANGQFVILPPPFAAGERALSLSSRAKDGAAATSPQAVTILGAAQGGRVVALAEPGAPTRILSDAASAPAPAGATRIRTVEAEQGGAFYASGSAPAGATVRLYLNGGAVADAKAGPDGAWSVRIEKGMTAGAYVVRADQIDANSKVASRAEVDFAYPAQAQARATEKRASPAAASAPPAAPAPQAARPPSPEPAKNEPPPPAPAAPAAGAVAPAPDVVAPVAAQKPAGTTVAQVRTQQVIRGDSLWRMSAKLYGSGLRYTEIYAANAGQIRNPNLIYPGQIFVAPERP